MALISSIYARGDESSAHYVSFRSPTKNGVLKSNRKASKVKRVNKGVYLYDKWAQEYPGSAALLPIDPLMEMLK